MLSSRYGVESEGDEEIIVVQNTDDNEAITLDDVDSTLYVTREGSFTRKGLDSMDEAEVFNGAENKITMIQTHSKKFQCSYQLHNFPFDTQVNLIFSKIFFFTLHKVCYVHMILKTFDQDTIDLIPDQIVMASPLALSQYEIKTWQLVYYDPGRSSFFAGNQN